MRAPETKAGWLGLMVLGGLIFGTATSWANGLDAPFLAQFFGMGWSWAAVGVACGWVAPTKRIALVGSTCALLSAVLTYYVSDLARGVYDVIDPADAALSHVTTGWTVALADLSYWMVAALLVGPLLGVVGHAIHRTDRLGLLAELVVPTMMVGNVLLVTARLGRFQQPGSLAAHAVIVGLAVLWAGWAAARRRRLSRSAESPPPST